MDSTKAMVQKVVKGEGGKYAVAISDDIVGSVTFSIGPKVWQENDEPDEGVFVFLTDLRQKQAGWRAHSARFWRLSDEGHKD